MILDHDRTAVIVVDVQGKLAELMADRDRLFRSLEILIRGAVALELPLLWTEQLPEKIGETTAEIAAHFPSSHTPIVKSHFSCWQNDAFRGKLVALDRSQFLIAGIEAHICVYQTAMDLLGAGYDVQVVADAVSSRTVLNRDLALFKLHSRGAELTTTEMALFELMRIAEGPSFKSILKLIT